MPIEFGSDDDDDDYGDYVDDTQDDSQAALPDDDFADEVEEIAQDDNELADDQAVDDGSYAADLPEDSDGDQEGYGAEYEEALEAYEPSDVDEDTVGSRDEYPGADDEDFEEDQGDWTAEDYHETAGKLFGDNEFFGETVIQRYEAEGYTPAPQAVVYEQRLTQVVPGANETVNFFEKAGQLILQGFVTIAALETLRHTFPQADLSQLEVTVPPPIGEPVAPTPLPPAFANVAIADKVDLRKFCSPVGDQGQTSRCAAFAWTHALELVGNALGKSFPRLSPSYTMWQIQQRQGDAKDYAYAYKGGDGCSLSVECGDILAQGGTCSQKLWPDDAPKPTASDAALSSDAAQYLLPALVQAITIEDIKTVLSAGCPVQVAMTTGSNFADIGRDGLFNAAEKAKGQHGYHAMLIVGYVSNYYIVKNSWGADWGDGGYCYVPKKVLQDSKPEFVAILVQKPLPDSVPEPAKAGVVCPACGQTVPRGKFCTDCGRPLAAPASCRQCGTGLAPGARFCTSCGCKV